MNVKKTVVLLNIFVISDKHFQASLMHRELRKNIYSVSSVMTKPLLSLTFDQINASLLNKHKTLQTPNL